MKCPKCDYLGFDTGNRCRNCGYDFSLIGNVTVTPARTTPNPDLDLPLADRDRLPSPTPAWADQIDRALTEPPTAPPIEHPQPPPSFRGEPALPLFSGPDDDEPLIKVPATPRPPLAVRRTPDTPRLRTVARSREIEPTLQFRDEPEAAPAPAAPPAPRRDVTYGPEDVSSIGPRLTAGAIDYSILLAIDAAVVYFTLRLAALTWSDWGQLPPIPMLVFLALIQFAYFAAFTAFGGQTIGKMAVGIRVVADDNHLLDPTRAAQRSLAGIVSVLTFGAGFVPAFIGGDRRTLHDRLAHTRVVALRTA
jgi:uncharacterized RDD family membrane protein YckC